MSEINRYINYIDSILPGVRVWDYKNKEMSVSAQLAYMFSRTARMFCWDGLPDTIPERMFELYLQINGNVCITEVGGALYAFTGGLGGEPDAYYMPTLYTVANPALKFSKSLKIGEECIVIPNDTMYMGLMPLYRRYATMITEAELSMYIALVNSRIIDLISAGDDRTKKSAEKYLEDVKKGELGVIAENSFLEGINGLKTSNYGNAGRGNVITQLIEAQQYYKAGWFNEIGLNANYNMKRESLNSAESQLNNDALLPLVDDMLKQRQRGADLINKMFGLNVSVTLASSWLDNQQEIDAEQDAITETTEETQEPEQEETQEPEQNETVDIEPENEETEEIEPETDEKLIDTVVEIVAEQIAEAMNELTEDQIEGGDSNEEIE